MAGFETAALIDRDVDQYGAAFHCLKHFPRHQLWRGGSGYKHGTDDEVRISNGARNGGAGGIGGFNLAAEKHVEFGQPLIVDIINGHVSALSHCHLRSIHPGHATTENGDTSRWNPGDAAEQNAAAALFLFKIMRPHLDRHPACNF